MKNFLAGVGLGALIGVIIAPASGEETRAQLRDGAEQVGEQLGDRMRDVNEAGEAQDGKAADQDIPDVVGNMSRKAIDLQRSGDVKTV